MSQQDKKSMIYSTYIKKKKNTDEMYSLKSFCNLDLIQGHNTP